MTTAISNQHHQAQSKTGSEAQSKTGSEAQSKTGGAVTSVSMSEIRLGQKQLFYLFDVAETVDLRLIPSLIGGPVVAARLAPKPATPAYVKYEHPSLSFEGDAVGFAELNGFTVRVRTY